MQYERGLRTEFKATYVCKLRAGAEAARVAEVRRETKETKVLVSVNLDGTGVCTSNSQIPFLDHMMDVRPPARARFASFCELL